MIKISIVNHSTLFSDDALKTAANAIQIQVTRDVYPVWGFNAQLYYTPKGKHPTPDHWVVGIFDDADQAGALGYHDVTVTGLPLAKVFARLTLAQGATIEEVISHETIEMLGDPDISLTVEVDDASGKPSKLLARELCDSPEDSVYNYTIDTDGKKIPVSDFVTPAWFESFNKTGPYDFMKKISKPFEILPGGYIGYLDLGNLAAGWQQMLGKSPASTSQSRGAASLQWQARSRPHLGSRRSKRRLPRNQWIPSVYTGASESIPAKAVVTS